MGWIVTVAALAGGRLRILPVYFVFGILAVLSWAVRPNPNSNEEDTAGLGRGIWKSFLVLAVGLGILSTGWGADRQPEHEHRCPRHVGQEG